MPGPCRTVKGIETGSEDIELLSDGFAFISTGLTWPDFPLDDRPVGIYGFDLNQPNEDPIWLPMKGNFNQENIVSHHGLSSWQDKASGEVTLFLISHRKDRDAVELFRFDKSSKTLHHRRTIDSPYFVSLNDLVATGSDSFYATNDGCLRWPSTRERLFMVEFLFFWRCGSVVYYDGNSARVQKDNYLVANGIKLSSNGSILYVAHYGAKTIEVFQRNQDNSITEIRKIDLHMCPDNINVHKETGDILAVGANGPLDFSVHPPSAPTSVLRIQATNGDKIDELLSDDGTQLSFGSVAERYGNLLLIGTVNNKAMLCELRSIAD
ncbi:serum paraoxonase/lactonase 3-like isoform X2 [Amphiura filiformis]